MQRPKSLSSTALGWAQAARATDESPYQVNRKMVVATADKIWVYDASLGLRKPHLDAYDRRSGRYLVPAPAERSVFEARFIADLAHTRPMGSRSSCRRAKSICSSWAATKSKPRPLPRSTTSAPGLFDLAPGQKDPVRRRAGIS